jgi:Na+/H+ antiporter NhaD/arsenite permease-like protein
MAYEPNPLMILPFGVLLAAIALAPLWFSDWWSRHYPTVAFGLAATVLGYYLFGLPPAARVTVLHTGIEYFSFIILIGSLFVVSGGIHITVKGEATPKDNVVFLLVGAVLANFLGTTGASMVLIRPWIRMNKYRVTTHHVVFFIFVVSNVGGCLTPIGDPPLFLGYLKGVPFFWVVERCWPMWLTGVGILLAMFYMVDRKNYLRAAKSVRAHLAEPEGAWRFSGSHNVLFLAMILGSVFINDPPFLREGIMIAAALGSWFSTKQAVHKSNDFNFHPIREVAILFIGIFATMMPALDYLKGHAASLGSATPAFFYWGSGSLSSVLDNAPTYLSFLSAAIGFASPPELVKAVMEHLRDNAAQLAALTGPNAEPIRQAVEALQRFHPDLLAAGKVTTADVELALILGNALWVKCLVAISVGSVFFGANTYIGNGPNFMVKAIADQQRVHTPGFLGYVFKFTLPFMLPMLFVVWLIFFR